MRVRKSRLARRLPPFRRVMEELDELRRNSKELDELRKNREAWVADAKLLEELQRHLWVPPGHFYSPVPSMDEVERRREQIFQYPKDLPGVDLNDRGQLELLAKLSVFYDEQPFPVLKDEKFRYYFDNPTYSYGDALLLYSMIRYLRPKRIIEVGSGHSSCVSLDTNDLFFGGSIECSFIEPYPELLLSLLRPEDADRYQIITSPLQDVEPERFTELEDADILFIDSTHVSRVGSDVNTEIFEILPRLAPGVVIHFHDIFFPFEYPQDWVLENRGWNEAYLLRAFLLFNDQFEVILFSDYLRRFYLDEVLKLMPLWEQNPGGSIWLRKRR